MSAIDRRKKNTNWLLNVLESGNVSIDDAKLAVLMDLRDELQQLNRVFACQNFLSLPRDVQKMRSEISGIRRDLKKRKQS